MDEVLASGRTTSEHWMDRLGEHFSLHRIGADADPSLVLSRAGPTVRALASGGGFRIDEAILAQLPKEQASTSSPTSRARPWNSPCSRTSS